MLSIFSHTNYRQNVTAIFWTGEYRQQSQRHGKNDPMKGDDRRKNNLIGDSSQLPPFPQSLSLTPNARNVVFPAPALSSTLSSSPALPPLVIPKRDPPSIVRSTVSPTNSRIASTRNTGSGSKPGIRSAQNSPTFASTPIGANRLLDLSVSSSSSTDASTPVLLSPNSLHSRSRSNGEGPNVKFTTGIVIGTPIASSVSLQQQQQQQKQRGRSSTKVRKYHRNRSYNLHASDRTSMLLWIGCIMNASQSKYMQWWTNQMRSREHRPECSQLRSHQLLN